MEFFSKNSGNLAIICPIIARNMALRWLNDNKKWFFKKNNL